MKDPLGHGSNGGRNGKRLAKPIPGHPYHTKSEAELRYIAKDAGEAAKAMRGHSPNSENKYLDQVNDAATVLNYRQRGGSQDLGPAAAQALSSGGDKSAPAPVHGGMNAYPIGSLARGQNTTSPPSRGPAPWYDTPLNEPGTGR